MKTPTFAPRSEGLGELSRHRGMLGVFLGGEFVPLPMAGGAYGTLAALDTLASASNTTVADFGEDRAWQEIDAALAAHNRIEAELLGSFVERTSDRLRRYGSSDAMAMDELDEFGRADAQKLAAGATVGFPLRLYGIALQWTRKYFQNAMASELAAQTAGAMDADSKAIQREVKRALFNPTNVTFVDRLVDSVSLGVKRLVNADSASIPLGPNGESFDGATHTHYLYTASTALAAADMNGLIETVIEHHATGQAMVYINRAQETAVRGLAGFTAYLDARIVAGGGLTTPTANRSLESFNLNDRAIGIYSAGGVSAEVWVKPWPPSGYLFAWVDGAPVPLVMRTRNANSGNLELVADDEQHPLRARAYEREMGFGVWTRTNGAALFVDAGAAGSYVAPTIT
jgi:hypothetical protein